MYKFNKIKTLFIIIVIFLNQLSYLFSEKTQNNKYSVKIIQKKLNKNNISQLYGNNLINNNMFRKLIINSDDKNNSKVLKNGIYTFLSNSTNDMNNNMENHIIFENITVSQNHNNNVTNNNKNISLNNESIPINNDDNESINIINSINNTLYITSNKKNNNNKSQKINNSTNLTSNKKVTNSNIRGTTSDKKNINNIYYKNETYNEKVIKNNNNSLNNTQIIQKNQNLYSNDEELALNKSDFYHVFNVIQDSEWKISNGDYYIIEFTEYNSSIPIVRLINLSVGLYNKNTNPNIAKQLISSIFGTRDFKDLDDEDDELNNNFDNGFFNINDIINWDDFDFIDEMPTLFRKLNNIIWF